MITNSDLVRGLVALVALLLAAHGIGALFARFRQPRVVGEIVGGLLLGPTVLGAFAPGAVAWMFQESASARAVIGMVQQLGLYLLMFCSGIEARRRFRTVEKKIVVTISVTGLVLPFLLGVLAVGLLDLRGLRGPTATTASFLLVFGSAIAVTSIPVISRILHDLDVLKTGFARVVLGVAVVEDVMLYAALAVAIDLAGHGGTAFGVPALLGLAPASAADIVYHVALTIGLLGALFVLGPPVNRWISRHPKALGPLSPAARRLTFLLGVVVLYLALDLEGFLGAFVAGAVVGTSRRNEAERALRRSGGTAGAVTEDDEEPSEAQDAIRHFAYAFFVPVYFALVGVQLDLRQPFAFVPFAAFLSFACLAKAASVYLGGRIAGLPHDPSRHLAVALNARGGPGIVLATVTLGAGIIGTEFYVWLVLLAVVTSLVAGSYLQRLPRLAFEEGLAEAPPIASSAPCVRTARPSRRPGPVPSDSAPEADVAEADAVAASSR